MGVDRPIVGFLTNVMLVQSDEVTERLSTWVQPRIEPEIAFITSRDIGRPFAVDEASSYDAAPLQQGHRFDLSVERLGSLSIDL